MSTPIDETAATGEDKPFHNFGRYLRTLRRDKGWSQAEIARELDVTLGYYGHWEQGRARPSAKVLLKLAKQLKLDLADLMKRAQYEDYEIEKWLSIAASRADDEKDSLNHQVADNPPARAESEPSLIPTSDRKPPVATNTSSGETVSLSLERLEWAMICIAQDPTYKLAGQFRQGDLPSNIKALVIQLYQAQTGRQLLIAEESEALAHMVHG